MLVLFIFIALSVFIFGLFQWARSGAAMWEIFRIRRRERTLTRQEREEAEGQIERLERESDRSLGLSFRIIAGVALTLWFIFGATIILEILGMDGWLNDLSTRAYKYWNNAPGMGMDSRNIQQNRNNLLRNMGVNMRK